MRSFFIFFTILLLHKLTYCQINFDNYEKSLNLNMSALGDIKNNEYNSAIPKLLKAIALDSTNRHAYINLYSAYSQLNQDTLLVPFLEKAKLIFQEDDEIFYYVGNVYHKTEALNNAITNYDSAIIYSKINGEDFLLVYAYYLNRGICFYKQAQYEKALEDFSYALKLKKNSSAIYANRGNTYFQLKMVNEACLDWRKAKELGEKTVLDSIIKYCDF